MKPQSEKAKKQSDLPIIESLGVAKVEGGWVLLSFMTQGDLIVSKEVLYGPELRAFVNERFKVEACNRGMC